MTTAPPAAWRYHLPTAPDRLSVGVRAPMSSAAIPGELGISRMTLCSLMSDSLLGTCSRRLLLPLALVPVVTTGACGQTSDGGGMVFRWEDVPPGAVVISMDTTVEGDDAEDVRTLEVARARLLALREDWSYGTLDGPDNTPWGWIRDVATDAEGNVYAIDGLLNLMRVLSPAGELIGETFRVGEGPMEIRGPAGVEFVGDTLMVYSPFGFIYASGEPQNLTEAARFFPENASGIEDACVGDALVLRIMPVPEPASVQAMNLDGTAVGIFGDVFEHDAISVRIDLSHGQIACSHGPKRVVISFNDGSLIHAYDYSGAPEWVAHLAGFQAPEVRGVPFGDGRIALSSPGESPEDRVQRLTSLPGGLILVQVNRMGPYEESDGSRLRKVRRRDSYILSAHTGAGVYVGPGLPEVLHATERRLFVMDTDDELDYVILRTYAW